MEANFISLFVIALSMGKGKKELSMHSRCGEQQQAQAEQARAVPPQNRPQGGYGVPQAHARARTLERHSQNSDFIHLLGVPLQTLPSQRAPRV